MSVFTLTDDPNLFPDSSLAEPNGLLATGGDLSVERLLAAYSKGIFPWYSEGGPILWWTPNPRCVLLTENFHMPKSLKKFMRTSPFTVTYDTVFADVLLACSSAGEREEEGSWLVDEMREAYQKIHELGIAHSVEVWDEGRLAGGLYGVYLGRVFFGESMFHFVSNASKVALYSLVEFLKKENVSLIDCQQTSRHLMRFGARPIPRFEFRAKLIDCLKTPTNQRSWNEIS